MKVLLKGIISEKQVRIKRAPAFTLASFKRTIKSIDVATHAGLSARALLLLGFTGAFRRVELSALNLEDLTFDEEGLIIAFDQSKTNQTGQADEKAIYYSPELATCPVRSLQA